MNFMKGFRIENRVIWLEMDSNDIFGISNNNIMLSDVSLKPQKKIENFDDIHFSHFKTHLSEIHHGMTTFFEIFVQKIDF